MLPKRLEILRAVLKGPPKMTIVNLEWQFGIKVVDSFK